MMKKTKFDEDRLSELPEHILHHIFSFLPFKQVVQTSMLSRRWERLWQTYPSLEFDGSIFESHFMIRVLADPEQIEEGRTKLERLYNSLEKVLRNRPMSLKKFTLDMIYYDLPECLSFIDKCVCYAIGSNVQELKLGLCNYDSIYYNLPQIVLYANSIEILELSNCKLELPRNNVMLSSLRKLSLIQVDVDDHMMKNLVAGCPLIEYLHVDECYLSLKNLVLFGLSRLKEIKLENVYTLERVDIEAHNVQLLSITGFLSRVINFSFCKSLRSLHLTSVSITDESFCSHKLPLLEDLRLIHCQELKCVKISSLYLRTLHCVECNELVELKIDAPNLHYLNYCGDVISLSLKALSLSKVDVELSCQDIDTHWYLKYVDFLAKFHRFSEVLNLQISTDEDVMVPRELRQILPSPLSSVKHLNLILLGEPIKFSIKKLLDGLLWISPHTKSISIDYEDEDFHIASLKFEFSYKKQLNCKEETISCCKSLPVSCWQHCIEEVNVEKKETHDLKGADIFETIDLLCVVRGL